MSIKLTETELEELIEHLSFDKMKSNKMINFDAYAKRAVKDLGVSKEGTFMRAGTIGCGKSELSPYLNAKLDAWISENKIPGLYE